MKPKRAGADRPSVHGVSTRSVDDLVRAMGASGVSTESGRQ
jgi:hypothetical protein